MQQEDELLKVEDVAKRLHVNARTVLRMVDRGELDAVKVARSWRFRSQDIDAYLQKHHTGPTVATLEGELPGNQPLSGLARFEPPRALTPLDLEERRIALEEQEFNLDKQRINYILETSQKMLDTADIDDKTKAKFKAELLETLLPQLLELRKGRTSERNGRTLEHDLHTPKQNEQKLRSTLGLDKT